MTTPEPFSLLLPVYRGDRPDYLRAAFHSAVQDQTLPPDQVILVRDGPVPDELARCIEQLCAQSPVPVTLVPLERSTGLGPALDAGLKASTYDIVARMDADDIALPHRFAVQVPLIAAGADIVGAGLLEFEHDPSQIVGTPRAADRSGRHPPLRAPGRPVQPSDRRVPPRGGAGGRRLRRPAADGGLLAVLADAGRWRAPGATWPSRWCTTASGPARTSGAAVSPSCARSCNCSAGCGVRASFRGRNMCATSSSAGGIA